MNAKIAKQTTPQPRPQAGHHRALAHLFGEYERARRGSAAAAERVARFEEAIRLLIDNLPSGDRAEFTRHFEALRLGVSAPRGGEVFENVVALFQKNPRTEWTVSEIQAALEKSEATPEEQKAIYNAINYLTKTGRLRRISRGRYVAADYGFGIEDEDRDDGTARLTEHDT